MTRVAVITANIGKIDEIIGIPKQTIPIDFFYYTQDNLPFPLPSLSNRLRGKYLKIQTHRFLHSYDYYVWLDGRVQITSTSFIENLIESLGKNHIALFKHRERQTVYEEMEYIIKRMKEGYHYLLNRYGDQQMEKELQFYTHQELPKNFPLYAATLFIRRNDQFVNKVFDEWWKRILEFSCFDQTMLAFVAWQSQMKIKELEFKNYEKHFQVNKHML